MKKYRKVVTNNIKPDDWMPVFSILGFSVYWIALLAIATFAKLEWLLFSVMVSPFLLMSIVYFPLYFSQRQVTYVEIKQVKKE